MNSALALTAWNKKLLETYSLRTVASLRTVLPLRMALPRIESFLSENVAKEAEKDALVIRRVGEMLTCGMVPDDWTSRQLLIGSKEIDRAFLSRVSRFPVGIVIRYQEIEPVRLRRIKRLQGAAHRILDTWHPAGGGRKAICASLPRAELEQLVCDLMRLYATETQVLSRSLRLPALLVPLRESLAQSLYRIMNDVAVGLAKEVASIVYRPPKSRDGYQLYKIESSAGEPVFGLEER